jgi:shikimate kinase
VEQDNLVVALGGGALVDDENRAFAKENGRVVYLEVDAETVVARVGDEADQRPLLQAEDGTPLSGAAMHSRVEGMLAEREATYADAHVTVDATGEIAEVVDAVTAAVREPDRA